jgi:hypothetical protein
VTGPFTQPSLFDDHAGPSRGADTSHTAGAAPGKVGLRLRVLRAIILHGPVTDDGVAVVLDEEKRRDSVSKRRSELHGLGLVVEARLGDGRLHRRKTSRGSSAQCWVSTMKGREMGLNDDQAR